MLLFLVHPLNIQAVTYIVQRMSSLATLFVLLGLGSYVTGRYKGGRTRLRWFALSALCFLLAVANKEIGLLLLPLLLLYETCFNHAEWRARFSAMFAKTERFIVWIGFGLLLILVLLPAWYVFEDHFYWFQIMPSRDFSGYERVLTQARIQFFYLSLLLWPSPSRLNLEHEFLVSRGLLDPATTLLALLTLLLTVILAVRAIPARPRVVFPILAYLLLHSMESAPISLEMVFEHRMYLPMTMLAMLMALNLEPATDKFAKPVCWALLVIAALLATATHQRNQVWGDPIAFYRDCAQKSPNKFRPQYNLGTNLGKRGMLGEARTALERALEIRPDHSESHNQLANVYLIETHLTLAEEHYRLAIEYNPQNAEALFNLANLLYSQQRYDEQREILEQFILHAPAYLEEQKQWAIEYLGH